MKKGNSKRRTLLATGLASLALLATISTATYAWFSINTVVNVNVSTMTAVTGDDIEISNDGTSWGSDVSVLLDELDSNVTDISGDGINFYTKNLNESTDYVEFDLQFRASSYFAIYLNNKSNVVPHNASGNKSAYGDFSKDYIAAAVRVAFLNSAGSAVNLVWIPNNNISLDKSGDVYSINTSAAAKAANYTTSAANAAGHFDTDSASVLTTSTAEQGLAAGDIYGNVGTAFNKNSIATIAPAASGVPTTAVVKVRVWIDGDDNECVNPLLGGQFDVTLGFSAAAITQQARPAVTLDAVNDGGLVTGYALNIGQLNGDNLEVSTDGTTYTAYSAAARYLNQRVWVRTKAAAATGGVPSLATQLTAGKAGQATPVVTVTPNPAARTFTLSDTSANGNGAALQYSIDNGANYNNVQNATITVSSMGPVDLLLRYAPVGDYNASAATSATHMLGKRATPAMNQIGSVSIEDVWSANAIFHHVISDTQFTAAPAGGWVNTSSELLTVGQYIAIKYQGDNENYVDSDVLYVQYTASGFVASGLAQG